MVDDIGANSALYSPTSCYMNWFDDGFEKAGIFYTPFNGKRSKRDNQRKLKFKKSHL